MEFLIIMAVEIWKWDINVSIFAAAIRNRCIEQTEEVRGYDVLAYRFLCCAEFFRILPWSGSEKKLQKFLLKSLEVMKKSLPLQPLSETKRTF